jgi:hypothetical protein
LAEFREATFYTCKQAKFYPNIQPLTSRSPPDLVAPIEHVIVVPVAGAVFEAEVELPLPGDLHGLFPTIRGPIHAVVVPILPVIGPEAGVQPDLVGP